MKRILIAGLIKKTLKKTNMKKTHVDVSSFALKSNLATLKTEVDKLHIDKLTPVSNDLAKLSNVVQDDVVKNFVYDKLVAKVNNVNTTGFFKKTKYEKDGSDVKIKSISWIKKYLMLVACLKKQVSILKLVK